MKPEENSEALVAADPSAAPAVPSALDIALPVASEPEPAAHVPRRGWGYWLREWVDAIVIAYVLAMFIRAFGLELYKIPSGSMTPTLVGDEVAEVDFNNDGARDLLVLKQAYQGPNSQLSGGKFQVFLRNGPDWEQREEVRLVGAPFEKVRPFLRTRYDRILVNKFAYWFAPPHRGDLIVFKVPDAIWRPEKPIYIKRAVAFGGEEARFIAPAGRANDDAKGRLAVNGRLVDDPPVFERLRYGTLIDLPLLDPPAENLYSIAAAGTRRRFDRCDVPEDCLLPLGDNTDYSYDGRYWGAVPLANLKGKAFFRYWPPHAMGFLH